MIIFGYISLLLDLIILDFSKYLFGNITFLFPMLTFIYIITYFYFRYKMKVSFILILFFYSIVNFNLFFTLFLLIIIYHFINNFNKNFKENIFLYFLVVFISIFLYDFFQLVILALFNYIDFNLSFLFYKLINSVGLNLLYGVLLYLVIPVLNNRKV